MNRKNFFEWFIELKMYMKEVFVSLEIDRCINIPTTETQKEKSVKVIIIMNIIYII